MSKRAGIEAKLSALAAIRPALIVAIVVALSVLLEAVLNMLFYRRLSIDWKAALILTASFTLIWYLVSFLSIFFDLRRGDARDVLRNPSFAAASFEAGIYGMTVLLSMALIWGMMHEHDSLWLQLTPLSLLALVFYAWPRTIHCGADAVTQRTRLGRVKLIPYNEILSVSVGPEGTITVLGENETIEHTSSHADGGNFADIVSKRSGKPIA